MNAHAPHGGPAPRRARPWLASFPLLALVLLSFPLVAQRIPYQRYTIADGLPQMQVMSLAQDSLGFLWVATKFGVARFDGAHFDLRWNPNENPDLAGQIFAMKGQGDSILISIDQRWVTLPILGSPKARISKHRDRVDSVRQHFAISQSIIISNIKPLGVDSFLLYQNASLFHFWVESSHSEILRYLDDGDTLTIELIHNIGSFSPHTRMLSMADSANLWEWVDGRWRDTGLEQATHSVLPGSDSLLQIVQRSQGHRAELLLRQRGQEPRLIDDAFPYMPNCGLVDDEGNIWIGSESGLFRYMDMGISYFDPVRDNLPITAWGLWHLAADSVLLWDHIPGPHLYRPSKATLRPLAFPEGFHRYHFRAALFHDTLFLPNTSGLDFLDGDKVRALPAASGQFSSFDLLADPWQDRLLVGGGDPVGGVWECRDGLTRRLAHLRSHVVMLHPQAREGSFWVGEHRRLHRLEGDSLLPHGLEGYQGPVGAMQMVDDPTGGQWLASVLGLFLIRNDTLYRFNLPHAHSYAAFVALESDSVLLVGMLTGLMRLRLAEAHRMANTLGPAREWTADLASQPEAYTYLGPDQGVLGNEAGQQGAWRAPDGRLWIGFSDLLQVYDPAKVAQRSYPRRFYLRSLRLDDQADSLERLGQDFRGVEVVELELGCVALGFHDNLLFQFGVAGRGDTLWHDPVREARFTHIFNKLGDWTLLARVQFPDGRWSQPIRLLTNHKPLRTEVLLLLVMSLLISVTLVISIASSIKNKRRLREQEELHRIERKKVEEVQKLLSYNRAMDTHTVINLLNNAYMILDTDDGVERSRKFIRNTVDHYRTLLKNTTQAFLPLAVEYEHAMGYLAMFKARFPGKLTVKSDFDDLRDPQIKVPKSLLVEVLVNSFKHGLVYRTESWLVEMSFRLDQEFLHVEVFDNGNETKQTPGSPERGAGTQLFADLASILPGFEHEGEKLRDADGQMLGYRVRLRVPLKISEHLLNPN